MSSISKAKFISSLAGMFAVGALAGSLATSALVPATPKNDRASSQNNRPGKPRGGGDRPSLEGMMMGKLREKVAITEQQAAEILPKIQQLERDVDQVRGGGIKETDQLFKNFKAWLLPILTDEQKVLHAKMEKEREEWMARESERRGKRSDNGRPSGSPPQGQKPPGN